MTHVLQSVPPLVVYLLVFAVVGIESLGIPVPGEIVLIAAALLASQGVGDVWFVGAAAVVGAVLGDSVGYALGRAHGDRLLAWTARRFPAHAGPERQDGARRVFARWGVWAVFVGRFIALLRIFAGPLAGSLGMRYPRFLLANAAGGLLWAGGVTALVYTVGSVAKGYIDYVSYGGLAAAVVAGVVGLLLARRRRAPEPD